MTFHEYRIKTIQERLDAIEQEKKKLLGELAILNTFSPSIEKEEHDTRWNLSKEEKIQLFIDLFRCREDVYPRLWENKTKGTKGYSPVCRNEWTSGICNKPKIKCLKCDNQLFAPLDEYAVRSHLEGKITIGTYAINTDDSCKFLAVDFDKASWKEDALTFKDTAWELEIDAYIEISRSGNGAHVWIFFSEFIPAVTARKLGSFILAVAETESKTFTLESYDRFFPNQDYLPEGGFGNLIALPLQQIPRENGRSVFVDNNLIPYPDQWAFLKKCRRYSAAEVNQFLKEKSTLWGKTNPHHIQDEQMLEAGQILNINQDLLNCFTDHHVEIDLGATMKIPVKGIPSTLYTALKRTATFANPKFFKLQKLRFSTWNVPKYIFCGEIATDDLFLPRGTLSKCRELFQTAGTNITVNDTRNQIEPVEFQFTGILTSIQEEAAGEILKTDFGVLVAPTGSGKTVMACSIISQRKVSTLIIVHRKQLIDHWKKQLTTFLDIASGFPGTISGGKENSTGLLDIAMLQTLSKKKDLSEFVAKYEQIIVDECHHIPAYSFESVVNQFPARYVLGLTATPFRKDGHGPIIYMQCGPVQYELKQAIVDLKKKVIVIETSVTLPEELGQQPPIHDVWDYIIKDEERLNLITDHILDSLQNGRFPLILSDRKEHLDLIFRLLRSKIIDDSHRGFLLTGDLTNKARIALMVELQESIAAGKSVYILSTGSFIGEGFDLPELDTLFLTMPVSFKGRLIQYTGRLNREHKNKNEIVVYDFLDSSSGLTISMFKKRVIVYKKLGYTFDVHGDHKILKWIKG